MRPKITQHWGDCTFYSSLVNHNPTDGICTCGYGWTVFVDSGGVDESQLLSEERMALRSGQSVDEQLKQHAASLTQENERLRRDLEDHKEAYSKRVKEINELLLDHDTIRQKLRAAKDALEAARPWVEAEASLPEVNGYRVGEKAAKVLSQINAVLNPVQGAEPSKTCHICGKLQSEPGELWCSGGHIRRATIERTPNREVAEHKLGLEVANRMLRETADERDKADREIERLREVLSKIPCSCGLSEKDIVDGIPHFPDCAVSITYESLKQQTNP